jgi:hypothetical protein
VCQRAIQTSHSKKWNIGQQSAGNASTV